MGASLEDLSTPPLPNGLAELRQVVIQHLESGTAYSFLDQAWRYLGAVPNDARIARGAIERLLDLGLGGPAQELLKSCGELLQDKALLESIRRTTSGRVPWPMHKDVFARNWQALVAVRPYFQDQRARFEQAVRRLHLFKSADGALHLSARDAGQARRWLPGLLDPAAQEQQQLPPFDAATVAFVDGLTLGPLPERIHAATRDVELNRNAAMIVIETDDAWLGAWLYAADHVELLSDPGVLLFCGPNAVEAAEQHMTDEIDLPLVKALTLTPPGRPNHAEAVRDMGRRVQEAHAGQAEAELKILRARYRDRDVGYWAKRLQRPGAVIGMTSRTTTMLQYSTRDIGHALEQLGYGFHLLIEPAAHCPLSALRVLRTIREIDPLFIVMVNHLRYEYQGILQNIPVLTWIQDPMSTLLCAEAGQSIGPLDFVCGYFRVNCVEQFGYPVTQFCDSIVPVSDRKFHDAALAGDDQQDYACDLMYAGHCSGSMEACVQEWKSENPPHLHPLFDLIHTRVLDVMARGDHLVSRQIDLVRECAESLGIVLDPEQCEHIGNFCAYRLFDIGYRAQTLEWAADWARQTGRRFHVYGRGWESRPALQDYLRGTLEHGEPLRRAYRGAALVLQAIPSGFRHQRSLEALCSGSLVVARRAPGDFKMLEPQELRLRQRQGEFLDCAAAYFPELEAVQFVDRASFFDLAERFLAQPEARAELAARFQRIVRERFTYSSEVARITRWMQEAVSP